MEQELASETKEQLNPKMGAGGVVDVEFCAQYLQLLHGHEIPEVRTTSTLAALEALRRARRLSEEDARTLTEGYLFSRRVENRLRLIHGYSLSHLPTQGRQASKLGRRLGYLGPAAGEKFLADFQRIRAEVRKTYLKLMRE
jgi:glutamate-ammonia-ligase adenylyltransferase